MNKVNFLLYKRELYDLFNNLNKKDDIDEGIKNNSISKLDW